MHRSIAANIPLFYLYRSLRDAQVGYEFQEGVLKGLGLTLSGTNLTNEPFVLNNVGATTYNLIKHQKYGSLYSLALTYKF